MAFEDAGLTALVQRAALGDQSSWNALVDRFTGLLWGVARSHRLARRKTVRRAELAEDSFVVGSATAEDTLLRASLPPDFQPRIDIVAAEWTGKLGCVAAGLGVALVPALAIRAAPADIALLRLHPDDASVRRVFAATVAGRSRPPAVTGFLTQLASAAGQHWTSSPRARRTAMMVR